MMLTQNKNLLQLQGDWIISNTTEIEKALNAIDFSTIDLSQTIEIDGSSLATMDTSGAYWMSKFMGQVADKKGKTALIKFHDEISTLVSFITARTDNVKEEPVTNQKDGVFVKIGKLAMTSKISFIISLILSGVFLL